MVENPSSHRYEVKTCNEMDSAFLNIYTCSSLMEIQIAPRDNSLYLIINPRSVNIAAISSFSVSAKVEYIAVSTKGLQIGVLINGK